MTPEGPRDPAPAQNGAQAPKKAVLSWGEILAEVEKLDARLKKLEEAGRP